MAAQFSPSRIAFSIGHDFADPLLLKRALTHRSYHSDHNERLEFLGDAVLNCIIASELYAAFPTWAEGELSRLRASLVNQSSLVEIAESLEISKHIKLGDGELKSGGASRPSILADTVEALIGATYLDGGFDAAADLVGRLFMDKLSRVDSIQPGKDAKTSLQELMQANKYALPNYQLLKIDGEAHQQTFRVRCSLDAIDVHTVGSGASRRAAEQESATTALEIALTKVRRKRR